jgi:hypothetical protein
MRVGFSVLARFFYFLIHLGLRILLFPIIPKAASSIYVLICVILLQSGNAVPLQFKINLNYRADAQ